MVLINVHLNKHGPGILKLQGSVKKSPVFHDKAVSLSRYIRGLPR